MDHITGGFAIAAGVSVPVSDVMSLKAGMDYLMPSKSEGSMTLRDPITDDKGTLSMTMGGSALGFTGGTSLRVVQSDQLTVNAVGSIGYYNVNVTTESKDDMPGTTPSTESMEFEGSGIGFNIGANASYAVKPDVSLEVGLGYRSLTIDEFEDQKGDVVEDADGDPLEIDGSGVNLRGGIVYRF